jgi:NADH-quinone oxidoreductase subunit G
VPTIYVDNQAYEVAPGQNLLAACLTLGFDLPYFCWHPAMGSVGACRQCAVKQFKDETDTKGQIVMACLTAAEDGVRISVEDPEAKAFRKGVAEWLMASHPHDCPVCDEGGECHLQDMTVMTGHVYRRYDFPKRTFRNQDLGPFINHEMNRCIQCYRCVRFYKDYAGGTDFEVLGWHDDVYFGRHADGTLENEFSGNLVEVCPTGVFTDKTLKEHYSRKWDLHTAPSICAHCGVGCNTIPGERYGTLRRIRARFNGAVNGYFLCDRGRYGYEFVNGAGRIRQPLVRRDAAQVPATAEEALAAAGLSMGKSAAFVGIGSPRASVETNFALRALAGPDHFFLGVSDARFALLRLMAQVLREGPAPSASAQQAAAADAVLVLGEDVWNTAPILGLTLRRAARNAPVAAAMKEKKIARWDDAALREAVRFQKGPFFTACAGKTRLDELAMARYNAAPADIARLGFAVAHELDASAPAVPDIGSDVSTLAAKIAKALRAAQRPLVVSGESLGSAEVIHAAANVVRALKKAGLDARISLVFPEANSLGAVLLARGGLESALHALQGKKGQSLVLAETDPFRHVPPETARALFSAAERVVVIDHTATAATREAHVVFPAGTFAESSGTFVSSEGRAQRFFAAVHPTAPVQESWRWLGKLAGSTGRRAGTWENLDAILAAIAAEVPELRAVREAAPAADFRINDQRVPRMAHRESGRTAATANIALPEPKPPEDVDSPLSWTMDQRIGQPPASLIPRFWAPGWNSDQSINKFQIEVGGSLRGGDPGSRLIEPSTGGGEYFRAMPPAFIPQSQRLLLVPAHHVFGSEELSVLSRGVASRVPAPYLAVSASMAQSLGLRDGQRVNVSVEAGPSVPLTLVVRELPDGIGAIPWQHPELPPIALPARAGVTGGAQ